jgi:NADPH-dependent 2,4-dienoyl-CoA reductase/sulfur reductase-like enzyme
LEGKKKVVVIGASFIGLESASSIKTANKELDITICDVS